LPQPGEGIKNNIGVSGFSEEVFPTADRRGDEVKMTGNMQGIKSHGKYGR
jgi:hypothetical protein